jgi:hypothetical protein
MAEINTKIKLYANKEVDFRNEVILQDDGNGVYIKEWNLNIPKPTNEQLYLLEDQANQYEQNLIKEQVNKEVNKQSALNKLKALGLNDAEIKAIIG